MTEQSTPSDLAAWVLDHGVGLTPARQKQLAKGHRRLEAQSAIRGRAVVMYRERVREAEAERDEWRQTALEERGAALDALEQIKVRDARIKAVRDIHTPEKYSSRDGAICQECLHGDGYSVKYPCPTIRALDGDA